MFRLLSCFHVDYSRPTAGPTKEIRDAENAESNDRFSPCLDRLQRESVPGGYTPGAESALQIVDRYPGRVSLLTPL